MTFYQRFLNYFFEPREIWEPEPDYELDLMMLRLDAMNARLIREHDFDLWETQMESEDA